TNGSWQKVHNAARRSIPACPQSDLGSFASAVATDPCWRRRELIRVTAIAGGTARVIENERLALTPFSSRVVKRGRKMATGACLKYVALAAAGSVTFSAEATRRCRRSPGQAEGMELRTR